MRDRDLGHAPPRPRTRRCGRRTRRRRRVWTMPERGQAVDQLEDEPEAEHDDRRDVDELVEEAEEDERRDPGTREEHEIGPERRRDRAGRADRRDGRGRVDGDLRQAGQRAAEQVEAEEPEPPEAVLDVVAEDPQVQHVAEQVQPAAVQELAGHERRGLRATGSRRGPRPRSGRPGRRPSAVMNASSAVSPPLASSPSSQAKTTKQATIERRA